MVEQTRWFVESFLGNLRPTRDGAHSDDILRRHKQRSVDDVEVVKVRIDSNGSPDSKRDLCGDHRHSCRAGPARSSDLEHSWVGGGMCIESRHRIHSRSLARVERQLSSCNAILGGYHPRRFKCWFATRIGHADSLKRTLRATRNCVPHDEAPVDCVLCRA